MAIAEAVMVILRYSTDTGIWKLSISHILALSTFSQIFGKKGLKTSIKNAAITVVAKTERPCDVPCFIMAQKF